MSIAVDAEFSCMLDPRLERMHCVILILDTTCSPHSSPHICSSTGDVKDARKAINITDTLQGYVNNYACADRLIFRETQRFDRIFGKDPSFDKPKQVRMRYRINGVHGFIILDIMENNQIPEQIM